MKQLKMYWKVTQTEYPEPYRSFTFRKFNNSADDINTWIDICRNGIIRPEEDETCWQHRMLDEKDFDPDGIFFALQNGEAVATITAIIHPDTKSGLVHMVAAKPCCRGQAVGSYLNDIAKAYFCENGCEYALLTTDEFRVAAVKSYLRSGFIPVEYDEGMKERWEKWLTEYGYTNINMINEETREITILNNKENQKLKVGIFGARRGCAFAQAVSISDIAYVSTVCDMDEKKHKEMKMFCCNETQFFTDFDKFIDSGMDIMILANFFHKHAEFAIRALNKGIHVLSETLPATTMKECVDLCEAVEKSGCKYMLSENYAYFASTIEMKKIYESGKLGDAVYAEGEYIHPMETSEYQRITPFTTHWRAMMPTGYYLSHSLAPLMFITGQTPVAVNAQAIYCDKVHPEREGEPIKDTATIMLCRTDTGALFRITGWAKFGVRGDWYRISASDGLIETKRDSINDIRLCYNSWSIPEGEQEKTEYTAKWDSENEKGAIASHNGSDYYMVKDFLNCVINNTEPFFDVYCASSMAATGILGWRSCMEHGKEFVIPDFRDKAQREQWKNDDLTPFPDENGKSTLPSSIYKK